MGCCMCLLFWSALTLAIVKVWLKLSTGWCRSNASLVGKTAIITGANTGIGYETAADFAKRGAKVILACRDRNRGETAKERIIRDTENPNVVYKPLDLSSLKSVREFAEDINNTEERLDILVNNAGSGGGLIDNKSEDGLQLLMQVNYFGHFLLTNLLLDLIKKTPNSRIINVSSMAAKYCSFDVNNLNEGTQAGVKDVTIYARTKLCNILFTVELAEKLRDTTVTVYSLHPGAVFTEIFRTLPTLIRHAVENTIGWFLKDSLEGAQTTIYCSVEKGIENLSGQHFEDCHVVKRYKTAQDPVLPSKLWAVSEKFVKLNHK